MGDAGSDVTQPTFCGVKARIPWPGPIALDICKDVGQGTIAVFPERRHGNGIVGLRDSISTHGRVRRRASEQDAGRGRHRDHGGDLTSSLTAGLRQGTRARATRRWARDGDGTYLGVEQTAAIVEGAWRLLALRCAQTQLVEPDALVRVRSVRLCKRRRVARRADPVPCVRDAGPHVVRAARLVREPLGGEGEHGADVGDVALLAREEAGEELRPAPRGLAVAVAVVLCVFAGPAGGGGRRGVLGARRGAPRVGWRGREGVAGGRRWLVGVHLREGEVCAGSVVVVVVKVAYARAPTVLRGRTLRSGVRGAKASTYKLSHARPRRSCSREGVGPVQSRSRDHMRCKALQRRVFEPPYPARAPHVLMDHRRWGETDEKLTTAFPAAPSGLADADADMDVQELMEAHLPPWPRAAQLCDLYLEQAPWFFGAVTRRQLVEEVLPLFYAEAVEYRAHAGASGSGSIEAGAQLSSSAAAFDLQPGRTPGTAHDLALLFVTFCFGALTDVELPPAPHNSEAEQYFQLTRAALNAEPLLERPPSVVTVQTMACAW
ncbi:predicted protein [Postia placenta Mad-698-R]|nr:predicted protein [Postia placenta Mad-698-R]